VFKEAGTKIDRQDEAKQPAAWEWFLFKTRMEFVLFAQEETKPKSQLCFQTERSIFGRTMFGLQYKTGLARNGKGNLSYRKIRI